MTQPTMPMATQASPAHGRRYKELVQRIQHVVADAVPAGATVLVVSKGDEELLRLGLCRAWHFPRDERGDYAGHYPADGAAAVAHLETLRSNGASYLVLPSTAFWWLDHYKELRDCLQTRCRVVVREQDTCILWELEERPTGVPSDAQAADKHLYRQMVAQVRELVASLLTEDDVVLVVSKGDAELLKLGGCGAWHFPRDERGGYAGHYPRDSAAAVAHLEALRDEGAGYLLFPNTAFWWLDHYKEFCNHLSSNYRRLTVQEHVCLICDLRARRRSEPDASATAGCVRR